MKYVWIGLGCFLLGTACQQGGTTPTERKAPESPAQSVTVVTGPGLNTSAAEMAAAYFLLADALVNWDTVLANKHAMVLANAADSIDFTGTSDSMLMATVRNFSGTIKAESLALAEETDIQQKRREFSMITDNFYPLLQTIQYNGQKLYYQVCPMAFNDNDSGYWISNRPEIVNPYLGTKHPKYASGMLHCGEVVDSIHYAK